MSYHYRNAIKILMLLLYCLGSAQAIFKKRFLFVLLVEYFLILFSVCLIVYKLLCNVWLRILQLIHKALSPPEISERNSDNFSIIFSVETSIFYSGRKCVRFASKMYDRSFGIFLKYELKIFGISAGIFTSPLRLFRIATIFAKIMENYPFFSIIFHNFLPLHCEEIFLAHVTLGQTCKKNRCL